MNPILLTSSFAMGRHVPTYVGMLDIGTPVCQVRRASKYSRGVTVQPSVPPEPNKTKTRTKLPTTARPSTPPGSKGQGSVIQKSPGIVIKARSAGANPQGSPTMGMSRPAPGKTVTQKSITSTNNEPWLKVRPASQPSNLGERAYTIWPGDSQKFALDDDQIMGYAECGSKTPTAKIVYKFHGTPGSRLEGNLDRWGMLNNIKFVCPERPGYGLSSVKRRYTVLEHADHVYRLSKHLGHHEYTTYGTSGGAPYALALAHLASRDVVTGTVLVVPATPPEAPKSGAPGRWFFDLKAMWAPFLAEEEKRSQFWEEQRNKGESHKSACNVVWRRSGKGRKALKDREAEGEPAGWVSDYRAILKSWGFDCCDVDARKIVIFAGGLDENTSAEGAEWMRKRLRNSRLEVLPLANHFTLQEECHDKIKTTLRDI